jgi:hypothetical protein
MSDLVATTCAHIPNDLPTPTSDRCQECASHFNLRRCATCGHVGSCESQRGHARAHALSQGHPVILSMPVGRGFTRCYADDTYVD